MWLDRYSAQSIDEEDIAAVAAALRSGSLTGGAAVEAFEDALCEFTGANAAIAVSNATAGLHAAYLAAGVGAGDEIITTPITFAATANAAIYCGAKPIFADIDYESGNIDPNAIAPLITKRTKAIVPVHYGGSLCDMEAICDIAARHKIVVIEDAAHALGSFDRHKQSAGRSGAIGIFSFHPVKPITTGEGGAVITDDPVLAKRLRRLRSHGIAKGELWFQDMQTLGFNYRLSDIAAALGRSQLTKLHASIAKREAIATYYDRFFAKNDKIVSLKLPQQNSHSRHLYPVLLDCALHAKKEQIFTALRAEGVGVQVHYKPVYRHSYYEQQFGAQNLKFAELFYAAELSLPCHQLMSLQEAEKTAETLTKLVKQNS
ncbi:UDP-4-amino-4,6-dideoxy-N-acetyl-beta-L-altrosamine transaminase [Campylobacterota bacterium]|nr:UDP-4-amino-4,6-dideoxy-N-acetyl-beta-L-altrosamine transaminase [Campylobacterota bacterium]